MTARNVEQVENLTEDERKNLAIDLITGENQNDAKECMETAWVFFLDYHNSTSAFSVLKPEQYAENIKTHKQEKEIQQTERKILYNKRKKLNDNTIDKCYKVWTRTNFVVPSEVAKIRKRRSEKPHKTYRRYRFILEPFYYYCKAQFGITFSKEEIGVFELIFLPEAVKKSLYGEYKDINFLEAILKYYMRIYLYYLENPTKKKLNHYFGKDFLDYFIFSEYTPPEIPDSNPINSYDEKGQRTLKFVKPTKEAKKSSDIWNKYNIKFRQYWNPIEGPIITRLGKNKSTMRSLGEWEPEKDYYSVYESLQIFYPEIMKELCCKVRSILLNGTRKKNIAPN